jgi:hypothetical protein
MKKRTPITCDAISSIVSKIRLTKWTAGKPVTKKLGLNDDATIKKLSTAVQLYEGTVAPLAVTPEEFIDLLIKVGSNDCLSYAIPTESNVHQVLSRERHAEQGAPSGSMTRTADKLVWPSGPAILMVDYDPPGDAALTQAELLDAIYSICPELKECAHVWSVSTSSCLYHADTGEELRGVAGQRVYIFVNHGTDIPRAGMVLFKRSWLAGYGHIKISTAGSLLVRGIIDSCVWQTNRIDYVAPPICVPPLVSRKPTPELLGNPALCLNTKAALPDLTADEEAGYQALVQSAKTAMSSEASEVRERYILSRVDKLVGEGISRSDAESTIRAALETSVLHAGFVLEMTDGTKVTVAEVLANKQKYHGMTFADPLEPEYHDDKRIAQAKLVGVAHPCIWSYAHGGHKYRLAFQRQTILALKGQRGEYLPKVAGILDTNDLVFARGSSLISIGDEGNIMLMAKHSLLALIDQMILFEQMTKNGLEAMDARLVWTEILVGGYVRHFRAVDSVLTAPCIVPATGRVISAAGYDVEQQVFVLNADQFEPIPSAPTMDDVRSAMAALWLPVSQFPYCDVIDQTVMVTAMLTAVVRKLLPTAPGFGFDAPVQGSGKTLLLKVLCVLAGATPTISPQPDSMNDEEMRKRIFAMLRQGLGVIVIDNIVGAFDSPSLAAVVTSVSYSDRVLGHSRSESVPSCALVVVSGNNLTLMGDLPRRFLPCRVDPKVETPHARSFDFDPEQLAITYRQELVAAAITLMRAYKTQELAKRPGAGRMASFEAWDDLVRQTVCWLADLQADGRLPVGMQENGTVFPALTDPMAAVNEAVAHDPYRERHGVLLLEVAKKFGFGMAGKIGPMFTVKELVVASDPFRNTGLRSFELTDGEEAALFEALVDVGGDSVGRRINKRSLGKYLAKNKDRIVNGMCLRQGPPRQRYATWWVESVDGELSELGEFVSATQKAVKLPRKARLTTAKQTHETHNTHFTTSSKPATRK